MTPLQQTALDFCRECMEWDAKYSTMFTDTLMVLRDGERQAWRFTNLNAVLDATEEFGIRCGLDFLLKRHSSVRHAPYHARVWGSGESGEGHEDNPCHALLAACLEAHRKLKGISHD